VSILGSNLTAGVRVSFGASSGTVVSVSPSAVVALTPSHLPGAVNVQVTNADGQASNSLPGAFTYLAPPPPTVSAVSPPSGVPAGGTTVTISGANFVSGALVDFGTDPATVTKVLSGAITAVTPAHAPGLVDVRVTNPDLQSFTLAGGFTFTASPPPPGPAPVLTSIDQATGTTLGGTTVVLSGSDFVATPTVLFGGAVATVTASSPTTITVQTPAHAAGAADVTVVNPDGQVSNTLAGVFTFQVPPPPAPTVSAIAPVFGPTAGGTPVTVTGTNFVAGATVSFGGSLGTVTALSDSSISVTTPARAAAVVDVAVQNPDGQLATRAGAFEFRAPVGPPPPVVLSLSPDTGPSAGGNPCVTTGTGFVAGSQVTFGGVPATLVPGSTITATQIQVTVPAHAVGAVDVTVTNPGGGIGTLAGGYAYQGPAPVVQFLNVRGGPPAGGTQVLAVGSGFVPLPSVTVGGTPATNVSIVSPGTGLTAVSFFTPPHAEGRYDVVVTNPDGQSATEVNGFHYGPPPSVTGLTCSPNGCDAVRKDDRITIDGQDFTTGAGEGVQVIFHSPDTGQQALPLLDPSTPPTPTRIVVVAPKLDGGICVIPPSTPVPCRYRITISNFDGQSAVGGFVTYP